MLMIRMEKVILINLINNFVSFKLLLRLDTRSMVCMSHVIKFRNRRNIWCTTRLLSYNSCRQPGFQNSEIQSSLS